MRLSDKLRKVAEASRSAARAFEQKYNEKGEELPDPTPVELPTGFQHAPTIQQQIAQFIRTPAFREQMAREMGLDPNDTESFDEANDFEVDDEEFDDVPTGHEMQEEFLRQARREADDYVNRARLAVAAKRQEQAGSGTPPTTPPVDNSAPALPDDA